MHTTQQNMTQSNSNNILVIGSENIEFSSPSNFSQGRIIYCGNMLDGITAAGREPFKTIYVEMASIAGRIDSALLALRRTSSQSRIVLLAQMYEEIHARQLISKNNGFTIADDYLIFPIDKDFFEKEIEHSAVKPEIQKKSTQDIILQQKIEDLKKLATEDDLTCLKNRRYVLEFLRQIIEYAKQKEAQVTLLVFDIDNFKHYNDTYGHATGDNVLKQAAEMMKNCFREHDIIGRIGGDEFAVIFWDSPRSSDLQNRQPEEERRNISKEHPRNAYFLAERFREEISSARFPLLGAEGKGRLTISGGLATFPRDGATVEGLFKQADMAMLEVKRSGKDRIDLVGQSV